MARRVNALLHVFFVRQKNPCTFRMVLASMARKVNALLHGFFRPAKKNMQFSHGFGLYG
jgi:hypothetical protein